MAILAAPVVLVGGVIRPEHPVPWVIVALIFTALGLELFESRGGQL